MERSDAARRAQTSGNGVDDSLGSVGTPAAGERNIGGVMNRMSSPLSAVGLVGALLVTWEVAVHVVGVADYVLPAPSQVGKALIDNASGLLTHTVTTMTESVIGLILGAVTGALVSVAMAMSTTLSRMLAPLLVFSQTVPIIVLAPLFVLWFGFGVGSKAAIVALMTFFPVSISMSGGMMAVDPTRLDLMHSMGATRWQTVRFVRLPASVPAAIDGLRISAAYAVGGAVVGEWTGATTGLGVFIDRSRASYRIDQVFAGVVVVSALSLALFAIVGAIGRVIAPWHFARRLPTSERTS